MAAPGRTASALALPPESFAIVRPPPSKGNHPLNVQIQVRAIRTAISCDEALRQLTRAHLAANLPRARRRIRATEWGDGPKR